MSGRGPRWIAGIRRKCVIRYGGDFDPSYGYVTINGTKYTAEGTQAVDKGTVISVTVSASLPASNSCYIKLDGETVQDRAGTYEYVVLKDSTIVFVFNDGVLTKYHFCEITTS